VAARYVARQAIFDRHMRVVGYELLFRARPLGPANITDDDSATFSVLYEALVELGLDSAVHGSKAWLNVTPGLLADGGHRLIDPQRVVLEILETAEPTPEVIALLRDLATDGYTVGPDEFVLDGRRDALLDIVPIVKLELPAVPPGQLAAHIAAVRRPGMTVLVEKVETAEQLQDALDGGADLFQGFFFTRPQVLTTKSIPASLHAVLAVLAGINDPDAELADLTALVGTDVTLAQKVLQAVNSGFVALHHRVDSLHQAVVLLGIEGLRQLVTLLVLARATGKPAELGRLALIRAEMTAELMSSRDGRVATRAEREAAFTVGLMSTLDAFTDTPLDEIAARLSLTEPRPRRTRYRVDVVIGWSTGATS
jgi:EAL and modified HD-GYP domain-containing signal transduction protein